MCSIRKVMRGMLAVGWAGVICLSGCALQRRIPDPTPMNTTPVANDGAMQKRLWAPSAAYYQDDRVKAWPNLAPLQSVQLPYELNAVVDTGLFLGNTFYAPVGLFIEPAWTQQTYAAVILAPTYNLMPPLPPGAEPTPR